MCLRFIYFLFVRQALKKISIHPSQSLLLSRAVSLFFFFELASLKVDTWSVSGEEDGGGGGGVVKEEIIRSGTIGSLCERFHECWGISRQQLQLGREKGG